MWPFGLKLGRSGSSQGLDKLESRCEEAHVM